MASFTFSRMLLPVLMRAWTAFAITSGSASSSLRKKGQQVEESFVRSLEFKQTLRVCNAYPYDVGLEVYLGKMQLTMTPLEYKTCGEFAPQLQAGDKVDFKVEGSSAGTFTISELPASDATLLMVIYRHDTLSTAVAFESHVFANMPGTQVAVIDTYKGGNASSTDLYIEDVIPKQTQEQQPHAVPRSELLRYNNVVAVNPGIYSVELKEPNSDDEQAHAELVAVPKESYVVLRVGVAAEEGKAYPQELVIFPKSDKSALGAAGRVTAPQWVFAVAVLLAIWSA